MSCIVVYYSRTGNTKLVGRYIADSLGCGEKRIYDRKNRSGVLGFLTGGYAAWRGKSTEIYSEGDEHSKNNHFIVGTPVWAGNPTPAIRTFLERNRNEMKEVSFFCTMGGSGYEKTFQRMEDLCRKEPVATLAIKEKEIKKRNFEKKMEIFTKKID